MRRSGRGEKKTERDTFRERDNHSGRDKMRDGKKD